ncbi:Ku protein [Streptomyces sp. NRAIS4]
MGARYYLAADGQVAPKPYKLLVGVLCLSSRVAIAEYVWSGRERLGMLRVRGDALVLQELLWPDEIRDPTELLPSPVEVSEEDIEGALALMDSMTVDVLEGEEFTDRYTEAIAQIIEAKREEKPFPQAPEPEQPKKEAATRKQPAKKTATKKTAAKKTTGRRPRSA